MSVCNNTQLSQATRHLCSVQPEGRNWAHNPDYSRRIVTWMVKTTWTTRQPKLLGFEEASELGKKKNGEEARRKKALVDVSGLAWFNNSLRKMVAYAWQALPTDWTGDVAQPVVYDISFNRLAGSYVPLHVDEPDRDAAGDIVCVFVLEVIHVATTHPTIDSTVYVDIYTYALPLLFNASARRQCIRWNLHPLTSASIST